MQDGVSLTHLDLFLINTHKLKFSYFRTEYSNLFQGTEAEPQQGSGVIMTLSLPYPPTCQ